MNYAAIFVVALMLIILLIRGRWKVYVKMGEPGWACLVPIYESYVLYKRVWNMRAAKIIAVIGVYNVIMTIINSVFEVINPNSLTFNGSIIILIMCALSIVCNVIGLIMGAIVCNKQAEAFGRGIGTTLGLYFLGLIFVQILGYGSAQYTDPQKREKVLLDAEF